MLQLARGGPQHLRHSENGGKHQRVAIVMPLALDFGLCLPGCGAHRQQEDRGGQAVAPAVPHRVPASLWRTQTQGQLSIMTPMCI